MKYGCVFLSSVSLQLWVVLHNFYLLLLFCDRFVPLIFHPSTQTRKNDLSQFLYAPIAFNKFLVFANVKFSRPLFLTIFFKSIPSLRLIVLKSPLFFTFPLNVLLVHTFCSCYSRYPSIEPHLHHPMFLLHLWRHCLYEEYKMQWFTFWEYNTAEPTR